MQTVRILIPCSFLLITLLAGCSALRTLGIKAKPTPADMIAQFKADVASRTLSFELPPRTRVDTVVLNVDRKSLEIHFSEPFSHIPFREENVKEIYRQIQAYFADGFEGYTISVLTLRQPIEQLVPNFFRQSPAVYDPSRLPITGKEHRLLLVQNVSKAYSPHKGLVGRNIGLWNSHGWYYSKELDRWEWQRPRLFTMVEDLIPTSFVIPYLIPMLENAGANVFLPRERDPQANEAIVDNDNPATGYAEFSSKIRRWASGLHQGFAIGSPPYQSGLNPFKQGTHRIVGSDTAATAGAAWTPQIPERGEYAVYVSYSSYDSSVTDALYSVHHLGGTTQFRVNQRIGGGTWNYLGTFKFASGRNRESGSVVLTNRSQMRGQIVSADAVRFGGGMGVIARNGKIGGRPKYAEGSRYYLQFAGMPDTLVYNLNKDGDDYRDDYQSRAEYLNYLTGAPFGPNRNREERGLGIPIDLSMAFHTDAGITTNDTTIGTLSIYSLPDAKRGIVFPDSMSRLANRDLADLVQTQIVNDVRAKFDPAWQRRQLRNGDYSEAVRPNMPSLLLELLSHQNYLDMKFVLDPRFRFDVSRAIYKGMLRFLASQYRQPYVVQPLPVTHFSAVLNGEGNVVVRWKPQLDPLEPSAKPDRYILYTRLENGGFDNGVISDTAGTIINNLKAGVIYSFKVTALNEGGESFPSEILSVCRQPGSTKPALIVNGFHRVSGPAVLEGNGTAGFVSVLDRGVPDRYELGFTGDQFGFDRSSPFRSNDGPGHGASFADNESKIIGGNTFDYPVVHGAALRESGLSFCSASSETIADSLVRLTDYPFVDIILGKEKETFLPKKGQVTSGNVQFRTFPPKLMTAIQEYCSKGGNLFLSGSYIGTDLFAHPAEDSASIKYAWRVLHFDWSTGHAARSGRVYSTKSTLFPRDREVLFNVQLRHDMYTVESPDAVTPMGGSEQLLRYAENHFGAAVGYRRAYGLVAMGFPFESVIDPVTRTELMKGVLRYLGVVSR
jgi:hypothetical protein